MATAIIEQQESSASTLAAALPPAACLYCGSTSFAPLYDNVQDRLGYVPGKWSFRRCVACGSALLHPLPRLEDIAGFYPEVYSFAVEHASQGKWKRLLARLEYRLFYQRQYETQARRVLGFLKGRLPAAPNLLDVGCGRGLRLLAFRRRGCRVQGSDFQASYVQYVKEQLGIPAVPADVEDMARGLPREAFDVITAFYVFEHVHDVAAGMQQALRLLKPGGWFVAALPFIDSWQARIFKRKWVAVTEAPRHLSLPSTRGVLRLCEQLGFTEVALRPDAVLTCAANVGLSLFPGCSTTNLYGRGGTRALLSRIAAACITLGALPLAFVENYVARRPAQAFLFARKPE